MPAHADKVPNAFISINVIKNRKKFFPVNDWVLDSGAFTTINKYGFYPHSVQDYAKDIKKWHKNGNMLAAVAQDYMCEPFVLAKTGKTIKEHQKLTLRRYLSLCNCDVGSAYILPVLQGYSVEDYLEHLKMYGPFLMENAWIGLGSVCKRNGKPDAILSILTEIKKRRPDLNIHGFGLKTTSIAVKEIRKLLYSADSMAWSFAARYSGRDANSPLEARAFYDKIQELCKEN